MAILETVLGGGIQAGLGAVNNYFSAEREEEARRQNFKYNEMAADAADRRTRALYDDFYSPQALMRQYQKAGLSPSLMFGGTPGQGGTSGAQGAGVSGHPSTFEPISILEGVQAANIAAQTENIKADTANKEEENGILRAENSIKNNESLLKTWETEKYSTQYKIVTSPIYTKEDNDDMGFTNLTLYELAGRAESYGEFIRNFESKYRFANDIDIHSESAQQTMREIYKISHSMQKELDILTINKNILDKEDQIKDEDLKLLKWQNQLAEALKNAGFAEMNAQAQIAFLKSQIASADLTERQKQAWNRLIAKMGDSTMGDIAVIVLSIISNMNISASAGISKKWE